MMDREQSSSSSSDESKDREPAQSKRWWPWGIRIGLAVAAFILTTFLLVFDHGPVLSGHEFVIGEPAPRTLFSPLALTYTDERATDLRRQQEIALIPGVYRVDNVITKEVVGKVDLFFSKLDEAKKNGINTAMPPVLELPFQISPESLRYLLDEPVLEDVRKHLALLFEQTLVPGLMAPAAKSELLQASVGKIFVVGQATPQGKEMGVRETLSLADALERVRDGMPPEVTKNRNLRKAILDIYEAVVVPNLAFDLTETENRRTEKAKNVPAVENKIKRDELVVQRGMLVTVEDKYKLDQIQKKIQKQEALSKFSAIGLLVFLSYAFSFAYLFYFEKKLFASLRFFSLIYTVFCVTVLICKVIYVWPGSSPYFLPSALAPLLFVLLVKPRLGVLGAAVITWVIAPMVDFRSDLLLASFFGGLGSAFAAIRVRKRIEFLRVGIVLGAVAFVVLFAFQLYKGQLAQDAMWVALLGFASGPLIATPILFILLAVLEHFFNLATDITLLELSDLNHPLLKRMVMEAPGTYHHSLVVSRLAESACEAIGANVLLARVGAYFHDIGKISHAEYFIENQTAALANKHENLSPATSAHLIINHVTEGMELGHKHNLKECILKFIPEHHGTGVVYFFYRKALDQATPGQRVDVEEFRYPGLKPQSKETAVALLADSVEAACRSLESTVSPDNIRGIVRKIINDKFIDHQLDECDLTLHDLFKIQESFVYNLLAIYHTRLSYPKPPENPDRPDLFEKGQFHKFRLKPDKDSK